MKVILEDAPVKSDWLRLNKALKHQSGTIFETRVDHSHKGYAVLVDGGSLCSPTMISFNQHTIVTNDLWEFKVLPKGTVVRLEQE